MPADNEESIERILKNPKEAINVDFKREYPLSTNSQKKEFAKDVACFANAEGGHIVVGFEETNGEFTLVGIDDESFPQKKKMRQVARDRVNPSVHVNTTIIEKSGKKVGVVSIDESLNAHDVDNVVYSRKGEECIPLSPRDVTRLYATKNQQMREAGRSLAAFPEFSKLFGEELPQHHTDQVRKILNHYLKEQQGFDFLSMVSKKHRLNKFFWERISDAYFQDFIDGCEIHLPPDLADSDRAILDALVIRAYGMLATAAAVFRIIKNRTEDDMRKNLQINLCIDLQKIYDSPRKLTNTDFFFEWLSNFTDFEGQPYDREILEKSDTLSADDFLRWCRKNHSNPIRIIDRANNLLRLQTKMNREITSFLRESKPEWMGFPIRLATDSWRKLLSIIRGAST